MVIQSGESPLASKTAAAADPAEADAVVSDKDAAAEAEANTVRMLPYRHAIESELVDVCFDVIALLETHLMPAAKDSESRVFYYQMCVMALSNNAARLLVA